LIWSGSVARFRALSFFGEQTCSARTLFDKALAPSHFRVNTQRTVQLNTILIAQQIIQSGFSAPNANDGVATVNIWPLNQQATLLQRV
jgi:hypothetical protein